MFMYLTHCVVVHCFAIGLLCGGSLFCHRFTVWWFIVLPSVYCLVVRCFVGALCGGSLCGRCTVGSLCGGYAVVGTLCGGYAVVGTLCGGYAVVDERSKPSRRGADITFVDFAKQNNEVPNFPQFLRLLKKKL